MPCLFVCMYPLPSSPPGYLVSRLIERGSLLVEPYASNKMLVSLLILTVCNWSHRCTFDRVWNLWPMPSNFVINSRAKQCYDPCCPIFLIASCQCEAKCDILQWRGDNCSERGHFEVISQTWLAPDPPDHGIITRPCRRADVTPTWWKTAN